MNNKTRVKKRKLSTLVIALLLLPILVTSALTLYEYFVGTTNDTNTVIATDTWFQTFTIGTVGANESFVVSNVSIKGYYANSGGDYDMWVSIFATNSSNDPTGNPLVISYPQDITPYGTNAAGTWVNVSIPTTLTLTKGGVYAIYVNTTANGVDTFHWKVNTSNPYAGGFVYRGSGCSDGIEPGCISSYSTTSDYAFMVYGGDGVITVTLTTPADNSNISVTYQNFTANYTSGSDLLNATYYVWNSTRLWNSSVTATITGISNGTIETIENLIPESYQWNVLACNSTNTCSFASSNRTFSVGATINEENHSATGYETNNEIYQINITTVDGYTPTNAAMIFNGTSYTMTITNITDNNFSLTRTITIPITSVGQQNISYQWDLGDYTQTSDNYTQTIDGVTFALCNSSHQSNFTNFTFQDETTNAKINATFATTWVYYMTGGAGSINKTLSFTNSTENPEYRFCFTPEGRNVTVVGLASYSASGYPQKITNFDESFSNITTNRTFNLLATASGIYSIFQVVNSAEQPLENVFANVTRLVDGVETLISSGYTGADGGITFFNNPDIQHTYTFQLTGYPIFKTTIFPTQTSYTINLGTISGTTTNDYTRGISYNIAPINITLSNNTDVNFTFNLNSSYWTVTEFGFTLSNSTDALASTSLSANSGTTSLVQSTGNDTTIIMNYYWIISGNQTNATRTWNVRSTTGGDWSLRVFFTDLRSYVTQGMFGIDNFGLAIITFLTIFIFTGLMSWKFGLVSPAAISTLAFTLVLFFDVGLGLLDNLNPIGAVPHFPTIFIGVIFIGILIRENLR